MYETLANLLIVPAAIDNIKYRNDANDFISNDVGIVSLDNDPMKYAVNMKIMSGIFEGYCLQLLLTFPDKYPIQPPKILIYPG